MVRTEQGQPCFFFVTRCDNPYYYKGRNVSIGFFTFYPKMRGQTARQNGYVDGCGNEVKAEGGDFRPWEKILPDLDGATRCTLSPTGAGHFLPLCQAASAKFRDGVRLPFSKGIEDWGYATCSGEPAADRQGATPPLEGSRGHFPCT